MVIAHKVALTRSLQWPPFLQDSFEGPSRTGVPSFLSPLFSLLLSSSAFISLSNLNGAPAVSCPRPWAEDSETETSMMQTLPGKGEPTVNIPCTGQMQGYSRGRPEWGCGGFRKEDTGSLAGPRCLAHSRCQLYLCRIKWTMDSDPWWRSSF